MTVLEALAGVRLTGESIARIEALEPDENGCLIWPFGKTSAGYGQVYLKGQRDEKGHLPKQYVHRLVCAAVHGPIPSGWHVDHVYEKGCRSRACFAPEHLEAVSPAENARRAGRQNKGLGFGCGHPFEASNFRPGGQCQTCHRDRERERGRRKRAPYRAKVQAIRELSERGLARKEIAAAAGCSVETVRRTQLGISNSRVPD